MPGMDGFGVIAELAVRKITWPVIVMTAHGDIPIAVQAMKLGAIEFIEKPFSVEDLESAVMRSLEVLAANQEIHHRQNLARLRLQTLTPRENEIIGALVAGAANKTVGYRLGLSTRTIEMHRASAINKLGLKSIAEIATLLALIGDTPVS